MPNPIVFFEIAGPDGAVLRDFYSAAFGWTIDTSKVPNYGYVSTGDDALLGGIREEPSIPAATVIYIGVASIDDALAQVQANGGQMMVPRMVIPNVVTFALFRDPAGNVVGLVEQ